MLPLLVLTCTDISDNADCDRLQLARDGVISRLRASLWTSERDIPPRDRLGTHEEVDDGPRYDRPTVIQLPDQRAGGLFLVSVMHGETLGKPVLTNSLPFPLHSRLHILYAKLTASDCMI